MLNLSERLIQHIQDLVCLLNTDGSYQYVSPSIQTIAAFKPEELVGKFPRHFAHPDDVPLFKPINLLQIASANLTFESRFKTKFNKYIWLETNLTAVYNTDGRATGFVSSSRVIDIRKKAQIAFFASLELERERFQLHSNFVSTAAHELRTPLAIIRSSLELAEIYAAKYYPPGPNISRQYDNIFKQIDRLNQLIEEVLTIGKMESEISTCKREEMDLVETLRKNIFFLRKIQNENRKVEFNIQGTARKVMADPLLINHAVSNILSNAFKYSSGCPAPVLNLHFQKNSVTIKIKDFGIGIPSDAKSKIFQAFYRAKNAVQFEGTGLGMYITKRFIELHQGKISFISQPNAGTEFKIIIPLED